MNVFTEPAAHFLQFARKSLGGGGGVPVVQRDVGARRMHSAGDCGTHAAGGARDEHRLAVERHWHLVRHGLQL